MCFRDFIVQSEENGSNNSNENDPVMFLKNAFISSVE